MDELDKEALEVMVNAGVSWVDHEASGWRDLGRSGHATPAEAEANVEHYRELRRRIPALAERFRRAGVESD